MMQTQEAGTCEAKSETQMTTILGEAHVLAETIHARLSDLRGRLAPQPAPADEKPTKEPLYLECHTGKAKAIVERLAQCQVLLGDIEGLA